jgi:hypothetical protein
MGPGSPGQRAEDRAGMIVRDLAEKFSISPSSVKRILPRAGARKRRKPPGLIFCSGGQQSVL